MAQGPAAECPACQKRFPWKAALVGRKVKCTCGQVFAIPERPLAAAPPPPPLSVDDLESTKPDVADPMPLPDVKCPSCNSPMKATAVLCLNCGFNREAGGKVTTKVVAAAALEVGVNVPGQSSDDDPTRGNLRRPVAEALESREDDSGIRPFTDYYLPGIFLVGGVAITIASAMDQGDSFPLALAQVAILLVIYVPLLLFALTLTANLMGISYGPLMLGLYKLAAIAFGPLALADFIIAFIASKTMGMGTFFLSLPIYAVVTGIPVAMMFDLETNETFMTVAVIVILRIIFALTLLTLFLSFFA